MQSARFGVGLLVGVLAGLLIIGASSVGGLQGSFGANSPSTNVVAQTTTATTSTLTEMNGAAGSTTTPSTPQTGTATTTTSNSSTSGAQPAYVAGNFASVAGASRLSKLDRQSPLLDALVLIPVLVALILGAYIYRRTRKPEEGDSAQMDSA